MARTTGPMQGATYTPVIDRPPRRSAAARGRRLTFLVLTAIMIVTVIGGFWPYFRAAGGGVARPWVIHLHALVFSGWMVLVLTQVSFIWLRRTDLHRRVGRIGIGYGVCVLVLGLVASVVAPLRHVASGEWTIDQAAGFLILPLGDMILFGGLFTAGIVARRQPEVHKRYMLLATIALMFAPAARLSGENPILLLAVWLLPLALAIADDLWTRRRIHRTYLIGLAALLIAFTRVFVMESPAWLKAGRGVLAVFSGS